MLKKRREALQAFEGAVAERLPTLRRMAEDAYREGSADILDLLDANRSLEGLSAGADAAARSRQARRRIRDRCGRSRREGTRP